MHAYCYYYYDELLLNFPISFKEEMEGKKKDKKGKKGKEEKVKEEENYPQGWLIFTIFKCFKRTLIESAFFKLLQDLLAFVSPQLLK